MIRKHTYNFSGNISGSIPESNWKYTINYRNASLSHENLHDCLDTVHYNLVQLKTDFSWSSWQYLGLTPVMSIFMNLFKISCLSYWWKSKELLGGFSVWSSRWLLITLLQLSCIPAAGVGPISWLPLPTWAKPPSANRRAAEMNNKNGWNQESIQINVIRLFMAWIKISRLMLWDFDT